MRIFEDEEVKLIYRPRENSHKGENGKVMVIGGAKLFHAAPFWAARVASKIVDLVHFSSPANENNDLVRKRMKEGFWEGIVVDWEGIDKYIEEDEAILIGPGMVRDEGLQEGERPTGEIVKELLNKHPQKRWVIDGGALQELELNLLGSDYIITPHQGEWGRLADKVRDDNFQVRNWDDVEERAEKLREFSKRFGGVTVLAKGQVDLVCRGEEVVRVEGGNAGMTKGGTGDVLAGLVTALYCKNEAFLAAATASLVNKRAGERLAAKAGIYYGADDLVEEVPAILSKFHEWSDNDTV